MPSEVMEAPISRGLAIEKPGEGNTNDWLTPPELVKRLGEFDLDPCGCPVMPWRIATTTYFLPDHDGLVEPWMGRVFCNPPYGPHISKWATKMAEHRNGIFLIYSRTETKAWKQIWEEADAFLFPYGRVRFHYPDGRKAQQGQAPSCLIAYGENNVSALQNASIAGAFLNRALWIDGDKISTF
jgi:hypothetical protein